MLVQSSIPSASVVARLASNVLLLLAITCTALVDARAAVYYVAANGSDNNSGTTLTSPWKSLNYAINKGTAGDTIYIRGGTYREQIEMMSGGAAGNLLKVFAYNGEVPVIKGSDVVTGWVHHSGAIWKKTGWTVNSQQVFVDFDTSPGKPLQQIGMPSAAITTYFYPKAVGSDLNSMTSGSFYYDATSTTLYVWLADGSNPNDHVMEASTRWRSMFLHKQYVHIKGLAFRHSNTAAIKAQGAAVNISGNSIIEQCDVQWADLTGIAMPNLGYNALAINNTISNNGKMGIASAGSYNFRIAGNKINNNNYRNFNALWGAGGFKGTTKTYGVIDFNEVAGNNGSGIWFDYANGTEQIIIKNNYIHDNGPVDSAIFFEVSKNGLIYNNVIVSNRRRGIYIAASDNTRVFNNTIVGTTDYAGIEVGGMPRTGATLTNNTVYNNIIANGTTLYDLRIAPANGSSILGNKSDYNLIFRSAGSVKLSSGSLYSDLASWRAATGMDLNSLITNPAFASSTGALTPSSFSLQTTSPAIDAGINLSATVTDDYMKLTRPSGKGVDIGAFESAAVAVPVVVKDTIAPVVKLETSGGSVIGGEINIAGMATDNIAVTGMTLSVDGVQKVASTSGTISFKASGLTAGNHAVAVRAMDAAGNIGGADGVLTIQAATTPTPVPVPTPTTSDTVPPVVSINNPVAKGQRVSVTASASDNVGITQMNLYVNGTLEATSGGGQIVYAWTTPNGKPIDYVIMVTAIDAAKNSGSASTSIRR